MQKNNTPFLCGGTFFVLLLQARKPREKVRDKFKGGTDGLTDSDLLKGLIYVVTQIASAPYKETFKKNTSEYKSCQFSGGTYVPFKSSTCINTFNNEIRYKYEDALTRMLTFVDTYIDGTNPATKEWLIKALLEVVETDIEIADSDLFYIYSNGQPTTKAAIRSLTNIEFQPFLLGILHYIILHRPNNKLGISTYEAWHEPAIEHSERIFNSNIGSGITRKLTIQSLPLPSTNDIQEDETSAETSESVIDEPNFETPPVINQYYNHPTIVNQYGQNNYHINHIETINF